MPCNDLTDMRTKPLKIGHLVHFEAVHSTLLRVRNPGTGSFHRNLSKCVAPSERMEEANLLAAVVLIACGENLYKVDILFDELHNHQAEQRYRGYERHDCGATLQTILLKRYISTEVQTMIET